MIAVIFESWPAPGKAEAYIDMGAALASHLTKVDGFISIERFRSVTDPSKLVALSFWRDEASVDAWRNLHVHRRVQRESRKAPDEIRTPDLRLVSLSRKVIPLIPPLTKASPAAAGSSIIVSAITLVCARHRSLAAE
jgi:heme-degrading monooxygenase HmoA